MAVECGPPGLEFMSSALVILVTAWFDFKLIIQLYVCFIQLIIFQFAKVLDIIHYTINLYLMTGFCNFIHGFRIAEILFLLFAYPHDTEERLSPNSISKPVGNTFS